MFQFVLVCGCLDATPLGRATAVVRYGRDVGDGAHLEAHRSERADRGLPSRAGSLDEDVDPLHAVLHRTSARGLGRHLGGIRGRLARSFEADRTGGSPSDHRARRVGDRDDGVVERRFDVGVAGDHVLLFLLAHLLGGAGAASCGSHLLCLLLAGDGFAGALARAGIGTGALAPNGQATAMTASLVRTDLDLASNVGRDLPAQVALYLVVRLYPVTQGDQLFVGQLVNADVATDLGGFQGLQGAGFPDAVDVSQGDLEPLLARQIDTDQAGHKASTFRLVDAPWFPGPEPVEGSEVRRGGVWRDASPAAFDLEFFAKSPGPRPPTEGGIEIAFERATTLLGSCSALPLLVAGIFANHRSEE